MQRDIHQAAQARCLDCRQASHVPGIQHTVPDDSQAAGTFGHEDSAVGEKRHAPRLIESFGHDQPDLVLDAGIDDDRAVGEWRRRPVDGRRRSRPSRSTARRPLLLRGRDDESQRDDRCDNQ